MINAIQLALEPISGGRVLDVATGPGGFIHLLIENLKDFNEITGVDTSEKAITAARKAFEDRGDVRFELMDAAKLEFPDASFDTVTISNSIHHMPDPQRVFAEMLRVLKPGGHFIYCEMVCDDQTDTQMTHVLLHHWWGVIDTARGVYHRETYPRRQLNELTALLPVDAWTLVDWEDLSSDPLDPEGVQELEGVIERYCQMAAELPGAAALQARGEELRCRVQTVGFHSATARIGVARKL